MAQRLKDLRQVRSREHGQDLSREDSIGMRRSTPYGIPLLRWSQGRQDEIQPVRHLDSLYQVRPSNHIRGQEGRAWADPPNGPGSSDHPAGIELLGEEHKAGGDERRCCQRQDHGDQGHDVADGLEDSHGPQPHSEGVRGSPREVRPSRRQASVSEKGDGGEGRQEDISSRAKSFDDSAGIPIGAQGGDRSDGRLQGQEGDDGSPVTIKPIDSSPISWADNEWRASPGGGHHVGRRVDADEGRQVQGAGSLRSSLDSLWWRLKVMKNGSASEGTGDIMSHNPHDPSGSSSDPAADCHGHTTGTTNTTNTTTDLSDRNSSPYLRDAHGTILTTTPDALPRAWTQTTAKAHSNSQAVPAGTLKKMALGAALVGTMVLAPVQSLMTQMQLGVDFMEVACAPNSSLSSMMEHKGYSIKRINYREGYDLETRAGTQLLRQEITLHPPRMTWVSLPCTRISPLVNLTHRTEHEQALFTQRQFRDLKRAEDVSEAVCISLDAGNDFAWEWPTGAAKGWNGKAIQKLIRKMRQLGRPVFWCRFHGCAYGLAFQGEPILKSWTVLTSNRQIWLSLQRKCPGHQHHIECRGPAAQASAYYPEAMVKAICQAVISSWTSTEDQHNMSLANDVQMHLLEVDEGHIADTCPHQLREEDPSLFALQRQRYAQERPTGKKLETVKQTMLRIHRASGHSSMVNLQKLLRMRQAPQWAIDLAGELRCPDCEEARRPKPPPPSGTEDFPGLFEQLGTDVFEVEIPDEEKDLIWKAKFILWRDRASGLAQADLLKIYAGDTDVQHWEPKSSDVLKSFGRWLSMNPAPRWFISDPATYYTASEVLDYMARSGIGVLTAPAEAHWVMGAEEGCINILKSTFRRMRKECPEMDAENLMNLSVHGHNQTIGASGFSPFQWCRGSDAPEPTLPVGLRPREAFDGMLKLKAKAKVAYEMEYAKSRMSRLSNATGRAPNLYKTGALTMVWRQQGGKGRWVGPLRVLLQEGSTLWLATGSAIVKAKLNQVRAVTRREELQASLEGTAVYRMPVTLDSLLRHFTGKHFTNICGETPPEESREKDVSGATVTLEPKEKMPKNDHWRVENEKWLIRVHRAPRLGLFTPARVASSPVPEDRLTGVRKTYVQPAVPGSNKITLEDDFRESDEPHRHLQERWTGETWLEISTASASAPTSRGTKRQKEEGKDDPSLEQVPKKTPVPEAPATEGLAIPPTPAGMPSTPRPNAQLDEAMTPQERGGQTVIGNHCSVRECSLPGGHDGPHINQHGKRFHWNSRDGITMDEDDDSSSSSSSSSSDSSEEMIPEKKKPPPTKVIKRKGKKPPDKRSEQNMYLTVDEDTAFSIEIDITPKEVQWLSNHPNRAEVWLSKKVMEKGKEKEWSKLTMDEKVSFDAAQAKELSNVLQSKALRSLTLQEEKNLNPKTVMSMRWVLTVKPNGDSKARLVVLGYQAPNLVNVQSSSPTMARLSRNMVLTMCANLGFRIRGGDVTSAFLQADQDMEDQNLTVWAPSELAVLFGAAPEAPVNAPRAWYDHLAGTLQKIGYTRLQADQCVFILKDHSQEEMPIVSVIGTHVDDLLVGGQEDSDVFQNAFRQLGEAYKWGKWEEDAFTFTGCQIQSYADKTIRVSQEEYTDRWIEEIPLTAERMQLKKDKATAAEVSALRGCVGTMAWRASQTSPQFLADCGLLLSEVPYATVDTLIRANKVAREMMREAQQGLTFFHWNRPWQEIATVAWADASQKNRPDQSSTLGVVVGMAPHELLNGVEFPVSLIQWKSTKAPRQVLGSNGAEVQSVTEAEDLVFRARSFWCELHGKSFDRHNLYSVVRECSHGAVVMDTRGIFDAATRNVSSLHGLRSSRSGYELTISVCQALQVGTQFRWVHGGVQLGDSLTKWNSRKVLLQFFANGQRWTVIHDPKFEAGRKVRKKELERLMKEQQDHFLSAIERMAEIHKWPWEPTPKDLRSMGDASTGIPLKVPHMFRSRHEPFEVTEATSG